MRACQNCITGTGLVGAQRYLIDHVTIDMPFDAGIGFWRRAISATPSRNFRYACDADLLYQKWLPRIFRNICEKFVARIDFAKNEMRLPSRNFRNSLEKFSARKNRWIL